MPPLPVSERDHRWSVLRSLLGIHDLVALVAPTAATGGDWARYLSGSPDLKADGVILVNLSDPPELLLDSIVGLEGDSAWIAAIRQGADIGVELDRHAEASNRSRPRVGVLSLDRLSWALRRSLGERFDLVDVTAALETSRSDKTPAEISSIREAAWIADRCLGRLLETAAPGASPHQISAELHGLALSLGAHSASLTTRRSKGAFSSARAPDRVPLSPSDICFMSIEVTSSAGYRAAVGRPVGFMAPDELTERVARAATTAVDAVVRIAAPDRRASELHAVAVDAAAAEGTTLVGAAGWGVGTSSLESPILDQSSADPVGANRALVVSCHVVDEGSRTEASVVDTVIVGSDTGRRLSEYPVGTFHTQHWRDR